MATDNYRKHTSKNPIQRFLIERFFDALLSEALALPAESILDAGCGEGFTLQRLRERGTTARLEGIDMNPEAVRIGKSMDAELDLKEGSIYALPYGDSSFDVVLCTEVLEHLLNPRDALAELHRVSRRYVLVSVPHEPYFQGANFLRGKNLSRWGNDIEHIQHWSARGIRAFVGEYFTVLTVRTPFPWTIVVAKK